MATEAQQFLWDLSYLKRNTTPLDLNGREVEELQYGSRGLADESVDQLAEAFKVNSAYQGALLLNSNHLTDLSVLALKQAFQTHFEISALDLAYNNLTERSGVYLGQLLPMGVRLKELILTGCSLEVIGVQRILEALPHSHLELLDIGLLSNKGLHLLAKHINKAKELKHLIFQESDTWSTEAKEAVLATLRLNSNLLSCEAACEDESTHFDFLGELHALCERNRKNFLEARAVLYREGLMSPKLFSEQIVERLETSLQHLPVRAYLDNTFGTLLNDALFELYKSRAKAADPKENTAAKNVQWMVKYLLSHLPD